MAQAADQLESLKSNNIQGQEYGNFSLVLIESRRTEGQQEF
jgi:hypothetical protein